MYELHAVTVAQAMVLLLVLAAHGGLIGILVRRGWLAAPRPTRAAGSVLPEAGKPAARPPHERLAA
jgi:hypothetical protein